VAGSPSLRCGRAGSLVLGNRQLLVAAKSYVSNLNIKIND